MSEQQTRDSESSSRRTRRPSSTRDEDRETRRTSRDGDTTRRRSESSRSERHTDRERSSEDSRKRSPETSRERRAKPKLSANKAILAALEQLQLMTTRTPESVVGVNAHEDGWRVTVEVVESARIPNTADIMAEYDVDIDSNGELAGYTRTSRYFRGRTQMD